MSMISQISYVIITLRHFVKNLVLRESNTMLDEIRSFGPDLLWISMTAPKQEKWVYNHKTLECRLVGSVGAAFDFYSGENCLEHHIWLESLVSVAV